MTKQTVLDSCIIEGNNVYLPNVQLNRKLYVEVDKALKGIGGKWNRKEKAHVFPSDPSILLGRVKEGENINLKKEFQFFATPKKLAERLIDLAEINNTHKILEPSAGQGAIVQSINSLLPNQEVFCYEPMPSNKDILNKIKTVNFLGDDFLLSNNSTQLLFDRIIANPPFSKNQDITHVKQMYNSLVPGGRLVSIMSEHFKFSINKKESEFREWLEVVNAEFEEIPRGTFKESGTMVGGVIVIINKTAGSY